MEAVASRETPRYLLPPALRRPADVVYILGVIVLPGLVLRILDPSWSVGWEILVGAPSLLFVGILSAIVSVAAGDAGAFGDDPPYVEHMALAWCAVFFLLGLCRKKRILYRILFYGYFFCNATVFGFFAYVISVHGMG